MRVLRQPFAPGRFPPPARAHDRSQVRASLRWRFLLPRSSESSEPPPNYAFTLVELLIVLAIIAILAAMLLPALCSAQSKTKGAACQNNLKHLSFSAGMYTADNDGWLPENFPLGKGQTNLWVPGNMKAVMDATNETLLRKGQLFPYARQAGLYRCPADPSQTNGAPRVRSYSMNSWMGSHYMDSIPYREGYRTFVRESELAAAGPSRLWLLADEHESSIDDAWFLVTMDDLQPFASFPATRHSRGYSLAFADGHIETYRMRDPATSSSGGQVSPLNPDWQRLKRVTTTR
jgi:prepilin-type N-terminal cleavage/methylation domain-containing protein/prepilin-type processing-associated H-X9-DG protein